MKLNLTWDPVKDFPRNSYLNSTLKGINIQAACVHAKLLQSRPTRCNTMDCSPSGSSVNRILQSKILKWVALPSFKGSSLSRDRTCISWISCIAVKFFTTEPPGTPQYSGTETIKKAVNTLAKTHNTLFTKVIFNYVLFIILSNPLEHLYLGGKHKR